MSEKNLPYNLQGLENTDHPSTPISHPQIDAGCNQETMSILILTFTPSPENRIWYFMQIVSTGDNLHEMSNLVSWENKKNISKVSAKQTSRTGINLSSSSQSYSRQHFYFFLFFISEKNDLE